MRDGSLSSGRIFRDDDLIEEPGRGAMGIVYRARPRSLGRDVALKMLFPLPATTSRAVARFRREAKIAATIRHPNVLHIHEFGEEHATRYCTMELVEGGAHPDLIRRWIEAGGAESA